MKLGLPPPCPPLNVGLASSSELDVTDPKESVQEIKALFHQTEYYEESRTYLSFKIKSRSFYSKI